MPRFFVPSVQEDSVRITGADGLHLTKALRVRPGEKLTLCDGNGTDALCEVASASAGEVDLRVLRRYPNETEPRLRLHLHHLCIDAGNVCLRLSDCVVFALQGGRSNRIDGSREPHADEAPVAKLLRTVPSHEKNPPFLGEIVGLSKFHTRTVTRVRAQLSSR